MPTPPKLLLRNKIKRSGIIANAPYICYFSRSLWYCELCKRYCARHTKMSAPKGKKRGWLVSRKKEFRRLEWCHDSEHMIKYAISLLIQKIFGRNQYDIKRVFYGYIISQSVRLKQVHTECLLNRSLSLVRRPGVAPYVFICRTLLRHAKGALIATSPFLQPCFDIVVVVREICEYVPALSVTRQEALSRAFRCFSAGSRRRRRWTFKGPSGGFRLRYNSNKD